MPHRDYLLPLFLLGVLVCRVGQAATARGPARSYRGEARRRRAGIQAQIGGEEEMFEAHAKRIELTHKVKELADKGAEFVFDSKEKVDAVFRCTACKKAVRILGAKIVGRLEIGRGRKQGKKGKKMKQRRKATRGKIRKRIRDIIHGVCSNSQITKDQNTAEQCPLFIEANSGGLEDMFLDHCDPEGEYFEDDVNSDEVCRSVVLTDTDTCPPGVKSINELVAGRINDVADEKRQADHAMMLQMQRERHRKAKEEEDRKVAKRLKKAGRKKGSSEKSEKDNGKETDKDPIKYDTARRGNKRDKDAEEKTVAALIDEEADKAKGDRREKQTRTRTVIRKIRRVVRIPRLKQQSRESGGEGEL